MKSKSIKQAEALQRLKSSTYANSKAKRKGTATEEQWQAAKDAQIERLES